MSPEQAEGRAAEPRVRPVFLRQHPVRSLDRHAAFAGATASDAIAAIVKDDPPLERLDAAVPARCGASWRARSARIPAARYTDTRELAAELRQARDDWERARHGGFTRRQAIAAVATVAASVAAGAVTWAVAFRDRGIRSLVVLPFANVGRDPDIDYLCSGLTEGLIARLSLPSMKVPGPGTIASLHGRDLDPAVVGRQLGVDAVVSGSIKRMEGRMRIEAALLDLSKNATLWNRSYDRSAGEALLVEEEIVRGILDEGIRLHPTDADRGVLARQPTADPAASDLYLRGLGMFRRATEDGYLAARDLFRQALARDARFAEAYAALAATFSVQAIDGYIRPNEAWAGSFSNADQAIALDPDNATAHAELGSCLFFFGWDVVAAERKFETARRARGGRYEPDLLIAYALERWATGRPQSALELARQARQLDPLGVAWRLRVADYTLATGNLEEAVRLYEELTRDLPDDPRAFFGFAEARRRQRRFDEAILLLAAAHAASGNPGLQPVLATAKGEEGLRRVERVTAQMQLEELRRRDEAGLYVSPLDFARIYAQLGDVAQTFAYFPAAFTEHSSGLVFLEVDRAWDAVRDHPEFRAAVRRVGLAVEGRSHGRMTEEDMMSKKHILRRCCSRTAAVPATLLACGDKFLMPTRGTRFQQAPLNRAPAAVLLYANPASPLPGALSRLSVDATLRKAGLSSDVRHQSRRTRSRAGPRRLGRHRGRRGRRRCGPLTTRSARRIRRASRPRRCAGHRGEAGACGLQAHHQVSGPRPGFRRRHRRRARVEAGGGRDEAEMMRTAILIGIALLVPSSARAQAWTPPAGSGSINVRVSGHRQPMATECGWQLRPSGKSRDASLYFELEYAATDRLVLSAGLPYVFARFIGPPPPFPMQPVDACYCWNSGWQDFSFSTRYNLHRGRTGVTPFFTAGMPSHDYVYRGEAVVGMHLREARVGVAAGRRLDAISPRLSVQGSYSYAFVEPVIDVEHNRSNLTAEVAVLATRKLSLRGTALWQRTHGGLRAPSPGSPTGDIVTQLLLTQHDRLMRDNHVHVGTAAAWSLPKVDVFGAWVHFLNGENTHTGNAFTVGVSYPFEWHPK